MGRRGVVVDGESASVQPLAVGVVEVKIQWSSSVI